MSEKSKPSLTRVRSNFAVFIGLLLNCAAPALYAVDPIPESEQAALAFQIIDVYDGPSSANPPQKLHVIYFTPADRDPVPDYEQRLQAILEDLRAFYRDEMKRNGFGPRTFDFERNGEGNLVVHLVKGKQTKDAYRSSWNDKRIVLGECRPVLKAAGIPDSKTATMAIFVNLSDWDETNRTFRFSKWSGGGTQQGGVCFVGDSPILNLDYLLLKGGPVVHGAGGGGGLPLGKRNSYFIGSIGHELGHAFGLPHSGNRWDEKPLGLSIMGQGNYRYRDVERGEGKGAILNMSSAMRLAARPLFNGSDKGRTQKPGVEECSLTLSTNIMRADLKGRRGALRLEGTVIGSPPIYAVITYYNPNPKRDFLTPTGTSVPDSRGRFAIEVMDLAPCTNAPLRVVFCHVNGGLSERMLTFSVPPYSKADIQANKPTNEPVKDFELEPD